MIRRPAGIVATLALLLASCGGGGGNDAATGGGGGTPAAAAGVFTPPAQEALTQGEVERILAQSVAEARARGRQATIAVTDRVGNVLAVFAMGSSATALSYAPRAPDGAMHDIQGAGLPFPAVAIAKAITGAYLSSSGNAFSTRTASEIVQEHFPPAPQTPGLESGPLFGVQFSSLPCSDLVSRATAVGASMIGPKSSPLGLSADPGGMPLYKDGVVVGGIGVEIDGVYGDDPDITDVDGSDEEYVALAGLAGFAAPAAVTADRITVDGTTLRFTDATAANLKTAPASAPAFATVNGGAGAFVAVAGFYAGTGALAGTAYGSEASGIRAATTAEFDNPDAFILTNGAGANRYPPIAGKDGAAVGTPLTATETRTLLEEAFKIMARARGQIRRPLDSRAQVTISVVDTYGDILGMVRGPDAPIFGTDVSLQKARTAAFLSGAYAGAELTADTANPEVPTFVAAARTFFGDPAALTGKSAFSDRAAGNISRPFFPDGQLDEPNGPFSRPISDFNPFSTGLQSALVVRNLVGLGHPDRCTELPDVTPGHNRLQNGIQIFPGSVPVYRGGTLVGGIGVSGDGIDQDDMIGFLGAYNAGRRIGGIGLPAPAIRSDRIVVTLPDTSRVRLRFINCPFAPFLDTNDQNVCEDK